MRVFSWIPVVVFILISSFNASAQDCFDYADQFRLEKAHISFPWEDLGIYPSFLDAQVQGDFAFVAGNYNGLVVLDMTDELNFSVSSITTMSFSPETVQVSGDLVLLAGSSDLQLVDASNPESPVLLGHLSISFEGGDLQVSQNIAYFESRNGGLCRVDFSDPNEPFELPLMENPPIKQIQTYANQLRVLDISGYRIFNISDPVEPVLVSFLEQPEGSLFYRFAVHDDLVYFTTYPEDFYIADFSDLSHPQIVQTINDSDWPSGGVPLIQDNLMFIVGSNQILALDISNPNEPRYIGGYYTGTMPEGLWLSGSRFLTLTYDGLLKVYDVTNPASILPQARVLLEEPFSCMGSLPNSGSSFTAAVGNHLIRYNLSDPLHPQISGQLDIGNQILDIAVEGDFLYVAAGESGLVVVSAAGPMNLEMVGSVLPGADTYRVRVDHGVAMVNGDHSGNLVVVDVSDPASPQIRGNVNTSASISPYDFILNDEFAYWISLGGSFGVLDISDLDHPEEISNNISYFGLSRVPPLLIHQDILYIGDRAMGRIDISNPQYPVLLDRTNGVNFRDFEIYEGVLYGPSNASGFLVVDVKNSDGPVLMGQCYQMDPSSIIAQAGGWFYVADDTGINIYPTQCSDSVPVFLSLFNTVVQDDTVDISWQVSAGSEAARFQLTGSTEDRTWTVAYERNALHGYSANDVISLDKQVVYNLYLENSEGQWQLLDSQTVNPIPLAGTNRMSAAPNPFNPNTRISFSTDNQTPVSLNVYDLNGRLVAGLFSGTVENHKHDVVWNGTDDLGRKLPSGTYFARFKGDGFSVSRKLLLVK